MTILTNLLRWLNPATDPVQEGEARRLSNRRAMIRGSQDSPYFSQSNLPAPTRKITDPRS